MDLHVDLGQIIIGSLIAIVGFFIRREITTVGKRLDIHDNLIYELSQTVQLVIGAYYGANGIEITKSPFPRNKKDISPSLT